MALKWQFLGKPPMPFKGGQQGLQRVADSYGSHGQTEERTVSMQSTHRHTGELAQPWPPGSGQSSVLERPAVTHGKEK